MNETKVSHLSAFTPIGLILEGTINFLYPEYYSALPSGSITASTILLLALIIPTTILNKVK